MKFNPITGRLRTDGDAFIKTLNCPIGATERDLIGNGRDVKCQHCNKRIVNLDGMDDEAVTLLFAENPEQCVSLSLDADNLRVALDD